MLKAKRGQAGNEKPRVHNYHTRGWQAIVWPVCTSSPLLLCELPQGVGICQSVGSIYLRQPSVLRGREVGLGRNRLPSSVAAVLQGAPVEDGGHLAAGAPALAVRPAKGEKISRNHNPQT